MPTTAVAFCRRDMKNAGYKHNGTTSCRDCHMTVEKWVTPKGKHVIYDVLPAGELVEPTCHWDTCEKRKPKKAATVANQLTAEATALAKKLGARLVVIVTDGESAWSYRNGESAAELEHDCITAGHAIRAEAGAGR